MVRTPHRGDDHLMTQLGQPLAGSERRRAGFSREARRRECPEASWKRRTRTPHSAFLLDLTSSSIGQAKRAPLVAEVNTQGSVCSVRGGGYRRLSLRCFGYRTG